MDLSIVVNGMTFPNPFLLGSGPPGTNANVIAKSYNAGWGGAVAKTISLESAKVVNVVPRYGKLRSKTSGEVIGFDMPKTCEIIDWLRPMLPEIATSPEMFTALIFR